MNANYKVVLDACVLARYSLCDLFLRLAETPRLYIPCWSKSILDEVQKVQQERLNPKWPKERSDRWRRAVEEAFPEASVSNYEILEPLLGNDPGDRHVLATAVRGNAGTIVTFNLRHFKPEHLFPWDIIASDPSDYLLTLYAINSGVVVGKLSEIATNRKIGLPEVLKTLSRNVPFFAAEVAESLGIDLESSPAR